MMEKIKLFAIEHADILIALGLVLVGFICGKVF